MNDYTNILFANPSFIEGMGRILDFGDTMTEINRSATPEQADQYATIADWRAIGADLRAVMDQFERENNIASRDE
jgi:hypothetical protein